MGRIAFYWLAFSTLILLFPTEIDPVNGITWDNFNYTPVILVLLVSVALGFWHLPAPFGAKHFFRGPKRTLEEEEIS